MMLSEGERRDLDQIERGLNQDDPAFVRRQDRWRRRARLLQVMCIGAAVLGVGIGVSLVVIGARLIIPWMSYVGTLVIIMPIGIAFVQVHRVRRPHDQS